MSSNDLTSEIIEIDSQINVVRFLKNLETVYRDIEFNYSAILQFTNSGLVVHQVPRFQNAQEIYFKIEKSFPEDDVVLVLAKTFDQIRSAYRNYFSDSSEFIKLLEEYISSIKKK